MKKTVMFLIAALACISMSGQTPPIQDSVLKTIEPIPITAVTAQSSAVTALLLEKTTLLYTDAVRSEIKSSIDEIVTRVGELSERQAGKDINSLQYRDLEDFDRTWKNLLGRLEIHQKSLTDAARKLESVKTLLTEMQKRWDITLTLAHEQRAPRTVVERIYSTQREINLFSQSIQENLNFMLIQIDRIGTEVITINQLLTDIDNAIILRSKNILSLDNKPLWEELQLRKDTTTVKKETANIIPGLINDLKELFTDFRITLIINFLLLVIILITFIYLFSNLSRYISKDDTSDDMVKKLAGRPVAAGFLVGLAVSFALYENAPESIQLMIAMLSLVPLAIIINAVMPPWFKKPVLSLIILDFMVRLYTLAPEGALFSRLFLLVVTLLSIGLMSWLLFNRHTKDRIKNVPHGSVKHYLLVVSLVICTASFFANILGAVLFSGLMTNATIVSSINIFLFYTLFISVNGLAVIVIRSSYLGRLTIIKKYSGTIQQGITWLLAFGAILGWLIYTLRVYHINRPVFDWLRMIFSKAWSIGSLQLTLGNIITFVLIIWLTIRITRMVRYLLEDEIMPRLQLKRGVPGAISLLTRLVLITVGFLIAVAALGVELSSLAILLGALGVGIGFGLQNIFNNLVSGLILAFERPIQEGDIIEIGELMGIVQEIGIRASRIKTYDGAEVIVPNGNLISNELINWTLADKKRRAEVLIGVAYGTDPQRVIDLLLGVVSSHPEVLQDPPPLALFTGFGESSLDFRLLFWIADADNRLSMVSKISIQVNKTLAEAGIEIPFPQHDLHLRSGFPQSDKSTG
jgi:small-conductance mechanosensitive channel